jgi:hypothetical protein
MAASKNPGARLLITCRNNGGNCDIPNIPCNRFVCNICGHNASTAQCRNPRSKSPIYSACRQRVRHFDLSRRHSTGVWQRGLPRRGNDSRQLRGLHQREPSGGECRDQSSPVGRLLVFRPHYRASLGTGSISETCELAMISAILDPLGHFRASGAGS